MIPMPKMRLYGWENVVRNLSSYPAKVSKAIVRQTEISQARVVADAKQTHTFRNRTYNLEGSIQPGRILVTDRLVEGEIVARTQYASFVEFGTSRSRPYPFLRPAVIRELPGFKRGIAAALKEAHAHA